MIRFDVRQHPGGSRSRRAERPLERRRAATFRWLAVAAGGEGGIKEEEEIKEEERDSVSDRSLGCLPAGWGGGRGWGVLKHTHTPTETLKGRQAKTWSVNPGWLQSSLQGAALIRLSSPTDAVDRTISEGGCGGVCVCPLRRSGAEAAAGAPG